MGITISLNDAITIACGIFIAVFAIGMGIASIMAIGHFLSRINIKKVDED